MIFVPLSFAAKHSSRRMGVPVAAHRGRAEPFHRDQVVEEEGVDGRPERPLPGHQFPSSQAGSAKASKRRPASASSWGVMVR